MKRGSFYRSFLVCTFLGALGEYMALTTLSWYLLETYHELSIMGKVLSFRILPRFFMGFVGGYLADRYDGRKMMIFIYTCIMIVSLIQTILITTIDQPAWYALAGVLFLRSIFDGAEPSVRNAILPHIVDKNTITKAIGYYATGLNMAAIIAPVLATGMMSYFKINVVFWIDWLFQLPSFIILLALPKIVKTDLSSPNKTFFKAYQDAFQFIYKSSVLFRCLAVSISMMAIIFPFGAMLSIYVKDGLHLGIKDYGYILGVEAFGAVLAGVLLHKVFNTPTQQFRKWYILTLLSGICLIFLAIKPQLLWVYGFIFLFGLLTQLMRSFSRVIFQEKTPDELRGKVMSIIISDSGFISIGLLFFTFLADKITIDASVLYMGLSGIIAMLILWIWAEKNSN